MFSQRVAMPVGLGQGLVRLLQFSGVLSAENPTVRHFILISSLNHESSVETSVITLGNCCERLLHSDGHNEIYLVER